MAGTGRREAKVYSLIGQVIVLESSIRGLLQLYGVSLISTSVCSVESPELEPMLCRGNYDQRPLATAVCIGLLYLDDLCFPSTE